MLLQHLQPSTTQTSAYSAPHATAKSLQGIQSRGSKALAPTVNGAGDAIGTATKGMSLTSLVSLQHCQATGAPCCIVGH